MYVSMISWKDSEYSFGLMYVGGKERSCDLAGVTKALEFALGRPVGGSTRSEAMSANHMWTAIDR